MSRMNNLWTYILAVFEFLTFGLFKKRALEIRFKSMAGPRSFAGVGGVDPQERLDRLQQFTQATGESADTFAWHEGIFATWSDDVKKNYSIFCANGLKPMNTADLVAFQLTLTEILNELSDELGSRG
jgi:hypothetical protein